MDKALIERVLAAACERLEGDWALMGGALAAVWFSPTRKTEDIDLVGTEGRAGERLQLMELASSLGLPVEAVNSAADFFLRKIPGWREELVLFRRGKRCRIFRLSPTAFLLLKLGRLDEKDLGDCIELIQTCRRKRWALDRTRVLTALEDATATEDSGLQFRRQTLARALTSSRARRPRPRRRR